MPMTSICTSPKQVILKYTTVLPQEIYLKTSTQGTRTLGRIPFGTKGQFTRVRSPNPEGVLTWDFTSNPEGDFLEYDVAYTTAHPDNQQEITFKAYFTRNQGTPGYWIDTEDNNRVNWTSKANGETAYSNSQISYYDGFTYLYGLIYFDELPPRHSLNFISDIKISGGGSYAPSKWFPYSFIWNIYLDGNLIKSAKHNSQTPNAPADKIVIVDAQPGSPESKVFNFSETPSSIKLKLKDNTEYSYQIIAKYPDNTEEIIHFFYGIDPTLLCFSEEEECPDNTCKVDCGEHYCCYGSNGIAVYSFLK